MGKVQEHRNRSHAANIRQHHFTTDAQLPKARPPGEDVELEVGDVVVACEVDGGLKGARLEARVDGVHLGQAFAERLPRHQRSDEGAEGGKRQKIQYFYLVC